MDKICYYYNMKQLKEIIKETLDFWPMTIVVPGLLILILFNNIG